MGIFAKDIELASEVSNWKVCFQVLPLRGWSVCEIMDQAGTGFYKPGQQNWLLVPKWKQDKMTISKKY